MAEKCMAIFLFMGSTVYLYNATKLTFGTMQSPRAGFLPIIVASIAVALAAFLLVKQCLKKADAEQSTANWGKFFFILIGFVFYVVFLRFIGYLAATAILLFYLFKLGAVAGWLKPLGLAVCLAGTFYLLFSYYLQVVLP